MSDTLLVDEDIRRPVSRKVAWNFHRRRSPHPRALLSLRWSGQNELRLAQLRLFQRVAVVCYTLLPRRHGQRGLRWSGALKMAKCVLERSLQVLMQFIPCFLFVDLIQNLTDLDLLSPLRHGQIEAILQTNRRGSPFAGIERRVQAALARGPEPFHDSRSHALLLFR